MSIAVSAVIRPSRQLRWLHALLCVLVLAAAGAFRQPVPQCVMAGAVLVSACRRRRGVNGVRLDISGVGGIRLAVYQRKVRSEAYEEAHDDAHHEACNDASNTAQAWSGPEGAAAGQEVWLMPGSTLWPALLLLRLRSADGTVFWLPVLPDTVAPDVLRRVALAMRAIAARGPPAA